MKLTYLIYCPTCGDIFSLRYKDIRTCLCSAVGGVCLDTAYILISQEAIPIGFDTRSFGMAFRKRPVRGPDFEFSTLTLSEEHAFIIRLSTSGNPVLVDCHHDNLDFISNLLMESLGFSYALHRKTRDFKSNICHTPTHLGANT
jgi:hypothetical protein